MVLLLKKIFLNTWLKIFFLENEWFQGLAPFQSDSLHQIMFEGIRGESIFGDIVNKFYVFFFNFNWIYLIFHKGFG
jgi:hypothetical protein